MGALGLEFSGEIFRKDFPMPIATNRSSAKLLPVRLRYDSGGYVAGVVLARNTTDGLYQKYANSGASGTGTAACFLFESHPTDDFDSTASTGSCIATGIFGGCTVYKSLATNVDSTAETNLQAREITDASGVTIISF